MLGAIHIWDIVVLILGFLMLIKGADLLVSGASSLAKRFRVSDLAIGLTIVAMGTSAPELVVNILSSKDGEKTSLAFGNIVGSNIFNLFLILGTASVILPLAVKGSVLRKDLPYSVVSLLLFVLLINDTWFGGTENAFSWIDGLVLLIFFVVYMLHTFWNMRRGIDVDEEEEEDIPRYSLGKSIVYVALGMVGLAFGGDFVVDGAVHVAEALNVDKAIVGLTVLAAGTSLPELATSVVAALNRKSDLAVGNVIGSNIFNVAMVIPVTALVTSGNGPMPYENILNLDIFITFFGIALLVLFMYTLDSRKIDRSEGLVLLVCFCVYSYLIYTRV